MGQDGELTLHEFAKAHHAASLQRHGKDHVPPPTKLGYKRFLKPPVTKGDEVNREKAEAPLYMMRVKVPANRSRKFRSRRNDIVNTPTDDRRIPKKLHKKSMPPAHRFDTFATVAAATVILGTQALVKAGARC